MELVTSYARYSVDSNVEITDETARNVMGRKKSAAPFLNDVGVHFGFLNKITAHVNGT